MRALVLSVDAADDTGALRPCYILQEGRIAVDIAAPANGAVTGLGQAAA